MFPQKTYFLQVLLDYKPERKMEKSELLNDVNIIAQMISFQEGRNLSDRIMEYIHKEEEVKGLSFPEKVAIWDLLKLLPTGNYTSNFVFTKVE